MIKYTFIRVMAILGSFISICMSIQKEFYEDSYNSDLHILALTTTILVLVFLCRYLYNVKDKELTMKVITLERLKEREKKKTEFERAQNRILLRKIEELKQFGKLLDEDRIEEPTEIKLYKKLEEMK